nr:hypothetical protein [uncultured Flavobacterium sp.]
MNLGNANAFAVDLGYDKQVNDLRYRQQAFKNQEALNEAKRRLFEQDLDYQNGGNSFDQPLVKAENQKIVQQIGDFIADNPDWETNFQKRGIVKQMKQSLKDNPTVLRAMATNDNRKKLYDYAASVKGKEGQFDEDDFHNELLKYQNYEMFGNPDGEEAASKEGYKPYLFTRPTDYIDENKAFREIGNGFKDMKVKAIKGGLGAYEEYANPVTLKATAQQMYAQNKKQFDKVAQKYGVDPISYIMDGIDANIGKKRDMGDYGLTKAMALEKYKHSLQGGGEEGNNYRMAILNQNASMVPADLINDIVGDGAPTIIKSKDGKVTDVTGLFKTKNTGYNFKADPTGKNKGLNGVRYAESIGYIPMEQAIEMGIVDKGFPVFGDDEVNHNYKDYAQIVTSQDDKGGAVKAVKITAFKPFDERNPANEGVFNAKTMTTKQRPMPSNMYQESEQLFEDEAGNLFDAKGNFVKKK